MALAATPIQERRQSGRNGFPPSFAVSLIEPHRAVPASGVDLSKGGVCLRLQEILEVRSLVQLQLTPEGRGPVRGQRSVMCAGRVKWVVQRLDLRHMPPFLFDIGIEFVDPPVALRHLIAQRGIPPGAAKARVVTEKQLTPLVIRGRQFVPRLERAGSPPRWHLVVSVEGIPCFSAHSPSRRAAIAGWIRFKHQQAKR